MRTWLGRALLLLIGLALALALGEAISRALGGRMGDFLLVGGATQGTEALIVPDAQRLWRLQPGARSTVRGVEFTAEVRVNDKGLRGPPLQPPQAGGVRVLALGDSFVLGAQVAEEQVLSSQLATELATRSGRPIEVLNAGVDGYGTQQETTWLRQLSSEVRPDAAVIYFFLGNDLWENARYQDRREQMAAGAPGKKKASQGPIVGWLLGHSHLFARSRATWVAWTGALPRDFRERYAQELALFSDQPVPAEVQAQTAAALQELAGLCDARRLPCLLALIPPSFVVDPDRAATTFRAYGLDAEAMDLGAPAALIGRLAPATLPVFDLSPALVASAQAGQRPYFAYDGHWSAAGHAVAAAATAEALAPLLP